MELNSLLSRFEQILIINKVGAYNYLQFGLEKEYIRQVLMESSIKNNALIPLYEWKNGTDISLHLPYESYFIFSTYYMYNLQDVLDIYNKQDRGFWSIGASFIKLFDFGGVNLLVRNDNKDPYVYEYNAYISRKPYKKYESVENMFLTIIKCFEEGAYTVNESKILETDIDLEWDISKTMNPSCAIWDSK